MAKGGGSIHIDRPADEVFAFVADAENNPRWRSYVVETTWLDDGPMRVGRRGRQVSKVLGRPIAGDDVAPAKLPGDWCTIAAVMFVARGR